MRPAYPTPHRGSHKGVPLRCAFGVPRGDWHGVMSGGLMCLAYPARPRGSHKGVPLRCAFGVSREEWHRGDVWRIDALGVPCPSPGQPQGRAPTLRVWRAARSFAMRLMRRCLLGAGLAIVV